MEEKRMLLLLLACYDSYDCVTLRYKAKKAFRWNEEKQKKEKSNIRRKGQHSKMSITNKLHLQETNWSWNILPLSVNFSLSSSHLHAPWLVGCLIPIHKSACLNLKRYSTTFHSVDFNLCKVILASIGFG